MSRRSASPLFRLASLLAILSMLVGWMEIAVPDVHDGHGLAAAETASVALSHDHAPASPEAPGHAPQSTHTCHCIHAHASAMPARADVQPRPGATRIALSSTERSYASVAPEPHFRPPVA
jgi:hypothetical protein